VNRQIWIFGTLAILIAGIVWMAVFFTFNTLARLWCSPSCSSGSSSLVNG